MVEESKGPAKSYLDEDQGEIELDIKNPYIRNVNSTMINQSKKWTDVIKDEQNPLLHGIKNHGFLKPSKIQAVAVPMIVAEPIQNIMVQSKNGSGKTGAFAIGSMLRVDPSINKTQVVVLCHTRELQNQISDTYSSVLSKGEVPITIQNTAVSKKYNNAHIITVTLKKLQELQTKDKIDLTQLRVFVVDEADVYFATDLNYTDLKKCIDKLPAQVKPQYLLFSATYSDEVMSKIKNFVQDARQIKQKQQDLKLTNVKQFFLRTPAKKKLDYIAEIFETCKMTQTIIFANTRNFCELAFNFLKHEKGLPINIIFGAMSVEERDEYIAKFRRMEISVIVSTDMLSRGFDVPEL